MPGNLGVLYKYLAGNKILRPKQQQLLWEQLVSRISGLCDGVGY